MDLHALFAHPWFGTWLAALIAAASGLVVHRVGGILLLRLTRQIGQSSVGRILDLLD